VFRSGLLLNGKMISAPNFVHVPCCMSLSSLTLSLSLELTIDYLTEFSVMSLSPLHSLSYSTSRNASSLTYILLLGPAIMLIQLRTAFDH
jgi:hypothetical protein